MLYNLLIEKLAVGDELEGFYVLKDAVLKTSSAGKPFLAGSVSDMSGSIEIKVWDYSGPVGASQSDIGKIIKLRGTVSEFKGNLQLVLTNIRLANETDEYDISRLVPTAPINKSATAEEVVRLINSIADADYRRLAVAMFERHRDKFLSIPAAKSVHHGFISGLLMHTATMMKAADFLSGLYPEVIDRSLLLVGTLLHDFAKEREFAFSELGLVTEYSMKGQLLGHLVMGATEVAKLSEELGIPENKSILLQHLLLSHHGEPEHGAAIRPMCAEAELLSLIDNMDSRMEIYAEALRDLQPGSFTGRIPALEKRIFKHE